MYIMSFTMARKRDYKPINVRTEDWLLIKYVGDRYGKFSGVEEMPVATTVRSMANSSLLFLHSIVMEQPYNLDAGAVELSDEEAESLMNEIDEKLGL